MVSFFVSCLGIRRSAVRLLLASTLSLYISSAVYWGTILEFAISTSKLLVSAVDGIDDPSSSVSTIGLSEAARACILTATFTVNVSQKISVYSLRISSHTSLKHSSASRFASGMQLYGGARAYCTRGTRRFGMSAVPSFLAPLVSNRFSHKIFDAALRAC